MIITIFIAFSIIIFLLITLIFQQKHLININRTLTAITEGNMNQRIRIYTYNKNLKIMAAEINKTIESFQNVLADKKTDEQMRKVLISNVSHDLRTPLTSLLGYIEVLKTDDQLSSDEKQEYIEIIEQKAKSIYAMMEDFFQLAKLEANDEIITVKRMNITEIIKRIIFSYYHDLEQANIVPIIDLPQEDIFAYVDERAFTRIINNLITNSLKYGKDGNYLSIKLRQDQDFVWVDVTDKGKGIPSKELQSIFERTYTLEHSRNRNFQGTGLGLTIVKKLIEKHNGQITVQSVPFDHTTFSFSLPKNDLRFL